MTVSVRPDLFVRSIAAICANFVDGVYNPLAYMFTSIRQNVAHKPQVVHISKVKVISGGQKARRLARWHLKSRTLCPRRDRTNIRIFSKACFLTVEMPNFLKLRVR